MSADLKKCETPNCDPQFQIRGSMNHEDYFNLVGPDAASGNYQEELHDFNREDVRIACKTCGLVTPWNMKDAPGAPGAVRDYEVKKWGETVDAKVQREHMLTEMEKQFGKDALLKHFGKSL